MGELDLEAIKARCEKATLGPWRYIPPDTYCASAIVKMPDEDMSLCDEDGASDPQHCANADFIAHARTDLPACVAEIERLRARVKELEEH